MLIMCDLVCDIKAVNLEILTLDCAYDRRVLWAGSSEVLVYFIFGLTHGSFQLLVQWEVLLGVWTDTFYDHSVIIFFIYVCKTVLYAKSLLTVY